MNCKARPFLRYAILSIGLSVALSSAALAEVLPGPADVGRIKPEEKLVVPDHSQDQNATVPTLTPTAPIPEGAKSIHFTLKAVSIEGMTAFTPDQVADIYAPY